MAHITDDSERMTPIICGGTACENTCGDLVLDILTYVVMTPGEDYNTRPPLTPLHSHLTTVRSRATLSHSQPPLTDAASRLIATRHFLHS